MFSPRAPLWWTPDGQRLPGPPTVDHPMVGHASATGIEVLRWDGEEKHHVPERDPGAAWLVVLSAPEDILTPAARQAWAAAHLDPMRWVLTEEGGWVAESADEELDLRDENKPFVLGASESANGVKGYVRDESSQLYDLSEETETAWLRAMAGRIPGECVVPLPGTGVSFETGAVDTEALSRPVPLPPRLARSTAPSPPEAPAADPAPRDTEDVSPPREPDDESPPLLDLDEEELPPWPYGEDEAPLGGEDEYYDAAPPRGEDVKRGGLGARRGAGPKTRVPPAADPATTDRPGRGSYFEISEDSEALGITWDTWQRHGDAGRRWLTARLVLAYMLAPLRVPKDIGVYVGMSIVGLRHLSEAELQTFAPRISSVLRDRYYALAGGGNVRVLALFPPGADEPVVVDHRGKPIRKIETIRAVHKSLKRILPPSEEGLKRVDAFDPPKGLPPMRPR